MKDLPIPCPGHGPDWSLSSRAPDSARDRILIAASTLFCNRGFAETGIDTIVAQAGTAKATLYKHFGSKEDLIAAVLAAEGAAWREWFFARLGRVNGSARDRVLAVFDALEEWLSDPMFYGCPFINAIAEFETGNERIRGIADAHKAHLVTWLKAQALELGVADVDEFARSIAVLIDGAIVAAQGSCDASFARTARHMAQIVLDDLDRVTGARG